MKMFFMLRAKAITDRWLTCTEIQDHLNFVFEYLTSFMLTPCPSFVCCVLEKQGGGGVPLSVLGLSGLKQYFEQEVG